MFEDMFYDLDEEEENDFPEPDDFTEPSIDEIEAEIAETSEPVEAGEVIANEELIGFDTEPDAEEQVYTSTLVETTKRSSDIDYPFLLLETDILAQHKLIALKSMLTTKTVDPDVTTYNVYLKNKDNVMKVGVTTAYSLRAIISSDVFADFKKYVKINPNLKVEGDMMYALCGVSV